MNADATALRPALLHEEFDTVAIDSREVKAGSVFFALSQPDYKNNGFNGDFEDAHKYIPAAFEKSALVCVARPDRFEEHKELLAPYADRLLLVDDTILALQNLAKGVYEEWGGLVVAVTGSAGKTTAKELAAHVLKSSGRSVLSNIKNYNNGLGQPITVLRMLSEGKFDVAVLEMGMSTPMHEIQRLCRVTPPDVAVELNVLPVHIEHLGSIEGVQRAKAELVEGMKTGGTAVLNADDPLVLAMSSLSKGKTLTYGIENSADVMATDINFEEFGKTTFTLRMPNGEAHVDFPLNGKHNILNALSAAAVGHTFGMTADEIAGALKTVAPPPQRGEILGFKEGFTVVNDSYNSNPDALISMVKTLVEGGAGAKRRILVAGEMRELGADSPEIHFETGKRIAQLGIDALYGVEGLAKNLIEGAKENGLKHTVFYENSEVGGNEFINEVQAGDLILVKGSRGVKTEKIVEKLLAAYNLTEE